MRFLSLVALSWAPTAMAQEVHSVCHLVPVYGFEERGVQTTLHTSVVKVAELERVAEAMGMRNVPVVLDIGDVRNAWSGWTQVRAGIGPGLGDPGVRTLGLSRSFLADARELYGPWGERFILAHELGHHMEAHRWSAKLHEEQADIWAVRTLVAMGASRVDVQLGLRFLANETSWHDRSETHPTPLDRVGVVDQVFLDLTEDAVAAELAVPCERASCRWEVRAQCEMEIGRGARSTVLRRGESRVVRGGALSLRVVPRSERVTAAVSQVEVEADGSCASAGSDRPLATIRVADRELAVGWGTPARRDLQVH